MTFASVVTAGESGQMPIEPVEQVVVHKSHSDSVIAQSPEASLQNPSDDLEVVKSGAKLKCKQTEPLGGKKSSMVPLTNMTPSRKTKRPLIVDELSELAAWDAIMNQPSLPRSSTLGRRWDALEYHHKRRGRIQVIQPGSAPVWVAQEDTVRAYKSLTTSVKVVDVNGRLQSMDIVIYTGACVTLASEQAWLDMGSPKLLPLPRPISLQDANGHDLDVRGLFVMNTWFGDQPIAVDALVIRDLAPAVLLGMDFLHDSKATLDMESLELRIPSMRPFKLSCGPPGLCNLDSDLKLEKNEVTQVWINAPVGSGEGQVLNIEERTIHPGVYVARSIGLVHDGKVAMQICNSTQDAVPLDKSRLMTTALVVQPCNLKPPADKSDEPNLKPTSTILSEGCLPSRSESKHLDMESNIRRVCTVTAAEDAECDPLWTSLDHLTAREQGLLYEHLQPYKSLFLHSADQYPTAALDAVGRIRGGEDKVVCESPYRAAPCKRILMNEQVKGLKEQGLIVETDSPWAAPVVLVEKPTSPGQWRLCIDYRSLNEVTDSVRWLLPRMDDTIAQLGDYEWFTTIDLAWGFWAIPLDERDQAKSAFITEDGHYQWTRLPMGWQGSPSIFQRAMDLLMSGLKGVSVLVYIDDLIIFSKTFADHVDHVTEVCKRLFEAGRAVKMSKVHWPKKKWTFWVLE